jgi:signal transduction histidine kinase
MTLSSGSSRLALYRWLTNGFAAAMLFAILAISGFFWSVPYLGFNVDPVTAIIAFIEPGGSAAQAGLQVGDHVLSVYGHPWNELVSHPNLLSLAEPRERPVPISIERMGAMHTFALVQGVPGIAFQAAKATNILLAMLCWLTGYILGVVRRHEWAGSPLVAYFWLGMSGVLGSYFFARYASYPLRLALQWLLLTMFIPLAVYIHVWFPVRPVMPQQARMAYRLLVGSWVLLNGGLMAGLVAWRPSLPELVVRLSDLLPISLLVGLIGSGVILSRAYRRTTIAHMRRQIHLIAMACFFVAIAWLLLLALPTLIRGEALIPDHWIDLLTGAVPLAYLAGGVTPDLYRVDRLLLRLGVHLGTMTVLVGLLAAITTALALHGMLAVLWTAICFVGLYRPVQHLGFRLLPADANPMHNTYRALHIAMTRLTATLEAPTLVDALCTGVRATFGEPALAFYTADVAGSNALTRVVRERLPQLPETIAAGTLTGHLCRLSPVTESRVLQAALGHILLSRGEEQVLHHPGLVLWCPIRHAQGYLLGVLLLGMRGDLDPYRAQDIRELQRLLEAAALALANSAAYTHQCEAEDRLRQLYQRLKQERAATAAAIARRLHDEILNVNVRLNIESLQKLIGRIHEPDIRAELDIILESEHTAAQLLRMVCEELHPTGLDDPLGLPALLRMLVHRTEATWSGTCRLVVEHRPCPIIAGTLREVVGIATEALTNAVKHAAATEIVVQLRYPERPDGLVQLTIRDNGRTGQAIRKKPGHLGVYGMEERAQTVGGTLQFRCEADGGTAVVLRFPPAVSSANVSLIDESGYATGQSV